MATGCQGYLYRASILRPLVGIVVEIVNSTTMAVVTTATTNSSGKFSATGLTDAALFARPRIVGQDFVVLPDVSELYQPTIANFSNAQHDHGDADDGGMVTGAAIPWATPGIVLGTAAAAGAAGTAIRSDSTIAAFDATVPTTAALGDAAATGSIAFAARRDHRHGMFAASAVDHGSISGLADDDHTQYVLVDGSRAITGDQDVQARLRVYHTSGAEYLVLGSSIGGSGTGAGLELYYDFSVPEAVLRSVHWGTAYRPLEIEANKLTVNVGSGTVSAMAVVDATGLRVGSGTAPTVALDVTGAALISSTLGVSGVVTASAALILHGDTSVAATAYTPSLTNLTIGNGTVVARYEQIGNRVFGYVDLTWGSTTSASGTIGISLPVNMQTSGTTSIVGAAYYLDSGTTFRTGVAVRGATDRMDFIVDSSGSYVNATNPFTWTTNDRIHVNFSYEAA